MKTVPERIRARLGRTTLGTADLARCYFGSYVDMKRKTRCVGVPPSNSEYFCKCQMEVLYFRNRLL